MPLEYREWEALWSSPAPWWYSVASSFTGVLTPVAMGLVVLLQWVLWGVLASQVVGGFGVVIGAAIAAAQILLFFGSRRRAASCSIEPGA